jgi:hypothetical protein
MTIEFRVLKQKWFKDVTDRPNGATHVRLNGATFRV